MKKLVLCMSACAILGLTACGKTEETSSDTNAVEVESILKDAAISSDEYDQLKLEEAALQSLISSGHGLNYVSKEFGENNTMIFYYEDGGKIVIDANGNVSVN